MKIEARISLTKIRFDQDTDAHLVVSLTAPTLDTDKVRPNLAMIICVDTSSSMQGSKIEYAKLSILKLIDHMRPDDYLGLVSFATAAKVEAPLSKLVTGKKDELRKFVSQLRPNGNTNFAGGMLAAIEELKNADLGANYIHRMVMFTDGQANAGPAISSADILKFFKANATDYITASAFGYGRGRGDFDAAFLTEFAREGKGNFAHVEDPDNALKAFGTELGGLASTYATNICIRVLPLAEHKIEKVISDVDADEDVTGEVTIKVPDLLAEEARHLVLAVKLAKQKNSGPRAVNAVQVRTTYETFDSTGKKETHSSEVKAKVQFVKDNEQTTPDMSDIVGLAQLVRAQLEAEEMAKAGNFNGASNVMRKTASLFGQSGNLALQNLSNSISNRVSNRESYTGSQVYLQSLTRGVTRGMGGTYSVEVSEDLDNLGIQTANTHQVSTSDSFTSGAASPSVAVQSTVTGYAPLGPNTGDNLMGGVIPLVWPSPGSVSLISPVPSETDNADKEQPKSVARKPVKQARSTKNW